jgi:hypothetical protein
MAGLILFDFYYRRNSYDKNRTPWNVLPSVFWGYPVEISDKGGTTNWSD